MRKVRERMEQRRMRRRERYEGDGCENEESGGGNWKRKWRNMKKSEPGKEIRRRSGVTKGKMRRK